MSIEAMKQALEALEWNYGTDLENIENCTGWLDKLNATIPALRQAIAEAEMVEKGTKAWAGTPDDWVDELRGGAEKPDLARVGEVGVWGDKREWVGLTDEDMTELNEDGVLFARYIEAKLREKNT